MATCWHAQQQQSDRHGVSGQLQGQSMQGTRPLQAAFAPHTLARRRSASPHSPVSTGGLQLERLTCGAAGMHSGIRVSMRMSGHAMNSVSPASRPAPDACPCLSMRPPRLPWPLTAGLNASSGGVPSDSSWQMSMWAKYTERCAASSRKRSTRPPWSYRTSCGWRLRGEGGGKDMGGL